ncbi:MAG: mechanosensitive ion channel domain-containing protein [Candidatus Competibacterales bacterium]
MGIRLCFLLPLLLGIASDAGAQLLLSDEEFAQRLTQWDYTLESLERDLQRPGISRAQVGELRQNLQVTRGSVVVVIERARATEAQQRRLLDVLKVPEGQGDTQSERLTTTRQELQQRLGRAEERRRLSDLRLVRIDILLRRMSAAEYQAMVNTLTERTVLPLAPSTLAEASLQLRARLEVALGDEFSRWIADFNDQLGVKTALGMAALPAIIIVMLWLLRRWLLGYSERRLGLNPENFGHRFEATLVLVVANALLPAMVIGGLNWGLNRLPPLDIASAPVLHTALNEGLRVVVIIGLFSAVLAPYRPHWRISRFTDRAAKGLFQTTALYFVVATLITSGFAFLNSIAAEASSSFDVSEEVILRFLRVNPELSATSTLLAMAVLCGLLLSVLRPRHWRLTNDEQGLDRQSAGQPPSLTVRLVLTLARIVLVGAVALSASGYLAAGIYLTNRISLSLVIVTLALLLRTLINAGTDQLLEPDTWLGKRLKRYLAFDDDDRRRLVFWLNLGWDTLFVTASLITLALLWGMPRSELEQLHNLLWFGFTVGNLTVAPMDIGIALGVFLGLITLVRLFQSFLANRVLTQTRMDIGAREAVATGVGYTGLTLATLVCISLMGLDLSQLALIVGALSVGIGFGLQHVVNNFISGLIILIQRPIKTGDWIVVGQHQGYVKRINIVATELQTFDNATVIVPNSTLLSSEVMNWFHKSKVGRVIVTVRVGYDSDPRQVQAIFNRILKEDDNVMSRPEPLVLFQNFGPSALEFELRFFIREVDWFLTVASEMRYRVKASLDEAGIAIPFPQQDIHIHPVEPSGLWLGETPAQGAPQGLDRDSPDLAVDTRRQPDEVSSFSR